MAPLDPCGPQDGGPAAPPSHGACLGGSCARWQMSGWHLS